MSGHPNHPPRHEEFDQGVKDKWTKFIEDIDERRDFVGYNGKPLSLLKMRDGQWAISCMDEPDSPIYSDVDANKVLQTFISMG